MSHPDAQEPKAERRSAPRLQLISPLHGHDDRGIDVTLVNISEGGLLIHTTQSATSGEVRQFRFTVGTAGAVTHFTARVVHVLRISAAAGESYAVGLEFVGVLPVETRRALETATKAL